MVSVGRGGVRGRGEEGISRERSKCLSLERALLYNIHVNKKVDSHENIIYNFKYYLNFFYLRICI